MSFMTTRKPDSGNELIVTGVGVGAIGVLGTLLLGATCPVCVVATPALIGANQGAANGAPAGGQAATGGTASSAPRPGALFGPHAPRTRATANAVPN